MWPKWIVMAHVKTKGGRSLCASTDSPCLAMCLHVAGCTPGDSAYDLVLGLSGAPDEPHAVNVSDLRTEGNGVGVSKEPPVNVKASGGGVVSGNCKFPGDDISKALADEAQGASSLCFKVTLSECVEVAWETLLVGGRLFVEIPHGILPAGSKER